MTPTDNVHTLAGAYALDALGDLERARFEAHVDGCASCPHEVAGFHDTTALLGATDEVPVSPEFRSRVLEDVQHVRQVGPVTARVRGSAPRAVRVGAARLQVVASPGSGAGAILANGLDEAPNGHAYQLWLITEDQQALPAGFLEVGEDGHGEQIMRGEMQGVVAVGITVEPTGGSEQPTTDPIAVLPLSA